MINIHTNRTIMTVLVWTLLYIPLFPDLTNAPTDGSDYTGGPFEVTFPAGVNVVSFNVSILDDTIAECAKLFNLDLDIPEAAAGMGVIRGSPDTATVHIMDDDGE